jgi:C1A family cysteine protease
MGIVSAQSSELEQLQQILLTTRASWTAGETSVSRLSAEEQRNLMGLLPGVYDPASIPEETIDDTPVRDIRYEAPHTSIKNQSSCGSCYSFGACATYESWKLVTTGKTYDLSEQWFMMKAKAIGPYGGCNGWYLDTSMNLLKNHGVCDESCCPYKGYETACPSTCQPNHKIGGWASTTDKGTIQNALQKYGLVYVGFAVYADFMNYTGGYYTYTTGSLKGYHAVAIVGFDGTGFKVKNSWGSGWGESGYFRIAYSQMTNSVKFGTCFGGSFYITN